MTKTSNHERKCYSTSSPQPSGRSGRLSFTGLPRLWKVYNSVRWRFWLLDVHPLCTKRYVSTRDHKTFFPYFSGRANSSSQQSTAVTVKSAENLNISPSQQKIPKCVFKKMLVLIAIDDFSCKRSSQGVLICNQGDLRLKMECGIEIRIETKMKGKCVAYIFCDYLSRSLPILHIIGFIFVYFSCTYVSRKRV